MTYRFELHRMEDETGISGVGHRCERCMWQSVGGEGGESAPAYVVANDRPDYWPDTTVQCTSEES